MKRTVSLILLLPFALNAGPVLSILDPYPSAVNIAAIARFKQQYDVDRPSGKKEDYTAHLLLEKSFFSLQQKTGDFLGVAFTSNLYTTALVLQNVTRTGINIECTTTHQNDATKKYVWPLTIPVNQNFQETKELDLLDDAGEPVSVTIKSTVTLF